jgi:transposase InsO family protein
MLDPATPERSDRCHPAEDRLVAAFRAAARPNLERVMTDNGSGFVSRQFKALCRSARNPARPHPPVQPADERKSRALHPDQLSHEKRQASPLSQQRRSRRRWLTLYLHFYNFHRAHSSLSYNPPISRLR